MKNEDIGKLIYEKTMNHTGWKTPSVFNKVMFWLAVLSMPAAILIATMAPKTYDHKGYDAWRKHTGNPNNLTFEEFRNFPAPNKYGQ